MSKNRNTSIELYRIIVMILIVAHHYVVNSGLADDGGVLYSDPMSPRSIFLFLFGAWGKMGINCFVLITGYYMCTSKITLKKWTKLFLEVLFYNFTIYFIFFIAGYEPFSIKAFIKALIPICEIKTNFAGCFLAFYLFIPILNILISNMSEKVHIYLLGLLFFVYVVFGTVKQVQFNYFSWFVVLYFIASYIRKYEKRIYKSRKLWAGLFSFSFIVSAISVVLCAWIGPRVNKSNAFFFVTDSNSFLALITAICLFLLFLNIHIQYNAVINLTASSTFGVLLIHANSDTMRRWLWKDLLNNVGAYSSEWIYFHAILSVIAVFLICVFIDQIRIRLIEKPMFCVLDKKIRFKAWDKGY